MKRLGILTVFVVLVLAPTPSATSTSLVIDVHAYGAKGDGATDDTTAVRAAIAAVPAAGGVVYFPCGVYVLTKAAEVGALRINASNVALRGDPAECAKLQLAAGDDNALIAVADTGTADGFTITHLTLDGNGAAWSGAQAHVGVQLRGNASRTAHNARIEGNRFINFSKSGYAASLAIDWGQGSWRGLRIERNAFLGNFGKTVNVRCATAGTVCGGYRIADNVFDNQAADTAHADYALQVTATAGSTGPFRGRIAGNRCAGTCLGSCIKVMASHAVVAGNLADNCTKDQIIVSQIAGSHCVGGSNDAASCTNGSQCPGGACDPIRTRDVTFAGNEAINGSDGGMGCETPSGKAGPQTIAFVGNVVSNNDVAGLYVECQDVSISGNTFDGNGVNDVTADAGVYVGGQTTGEGIRNVAIIGNTFADSRATATQKYGIQIPATLVDGTTIRGNVFRNQVTANITIADDALVANSLVEDASPVAFASLYPRVVDGSRVYCSDCVNLDPCAGGGTGAVAERISGAWVCNGREPTPSDARRDLPISR